MQVREVGWRPLRRGGAARLLAAALVVASAGAFAACGDDDAEGGDGTVAAEDLEFGYLTKQGDVPYFVAQVEAANEKADALGVELTTQDLQLDTGLALDTMDTLINQGVDGIAIVVPDQEIGPAVIQKAEEADVPLIAVDDVIEDADGNQAPYVGLDNTAVGGQVGEEIAALYEESPWKDDVETTAVASVELETLDVCNQRTDGAREAFLEQFPDFPEDQIISVSYDGTTNKAIDSMNATITGNADVDHWLIWSCNDAGVQGAVRALERAGVAAEDAIGVGLDGSLACDELERGSSFVASAYLDPRREADKSLQLLHDYQVEGAELPEEVFFPAEIVTAENVADVIPECK